MTKKNTFPSKFPKEKPTDIKLSKAMERMYDVWTPYEDRRNEFYSNFKYSRLTGIGKEEGVSRRDPSSVIKIDDTYYVWYTKRMTESEPVGPAACTDTLPAYDWDLCDIWYATSKNGFDWQEQGIAVGRTHKGYYGDRSATTADILVANGKYYLYFQSFTGKFDPAKGDYCDVSMAWSESPEGPWTRMEKPVVELGKLGEWDSRSIHDPFILVYKGKYWLYYKGSALDQGDDTLIRAQGAAVSDTPEGPFEKLDVNPVINSGHETCFYPYKEGIAAIISLDGPEKNTIQYAPDGVNFDVMSHIQVPPIAPGPFCPDAFADNGDGRGISWGLSHINAYGGGPDQFCFLARFDCDLNRDVKRPEFKKNNIRFDEGTYFQRVTRLKDDIRDKIEQSASVNDHLTVSYKDGNQVDVDGQF